jgi:predicted nucleic acid-binding Zn ribbon protein
MALGLLEVPVISFERTDDEEEDLPSYMQTEEICPSCGENIDFDEEIYLVQISSARYENGNLVITPVTSKDGDYDFDPYFMDIECWEDLVKECRDKANDFPPIVHPKGIIECGVCGSSVLPDEYFGSATIGELKLSERRPNDQSAVRFKANGVMDVICLSCLTYGNEEELELWEPEFLTQFGECSDCIHTRCWRGDVCGCTCHY